MKSVLAMFQNCKPDRIADYNDWYTHIHIRDAMRLDSAIAVQRFIRADRQPVHGGRTAEPTHRHFTLYEWESARISIAEHNLRAFTERMQISSDGLLHDVLDFYYDPVFLSAGWMLEQGFRAPGGDVMVALLNVRGDVAAFEQWFAQAHAPAMLARPGFATASLLRLGDEQQLAFPSPYAHIAVYSLHDRASAVAQWSALDADAKSDRLVDHADGPAYCYVPAIERLLARDVIDPPADQAEAERRVRAALGTDRYHAREEVTHLLFD